jgi:hypothetical protein
MKTSISISNEAVRSAAAQGITVLPGSSAPMAPAFEAIVNSPRVLAQRQQIAAAFGERANRATPEAQPAARPNQTGLPDQLKAGIESLSGMSMDNVKVHYGSDKPAQLNALAFAQGTDIHVASGQERHLPHEAWHIVQQAQGRVKPTMQMKDGVPVNDDEGLEREADAMGAKALGLAGQTRD